MKLAVDKITQVLIYYLVMPTGVVSGKLRAIISQSDHCRWLICHPRVANAGCSLWYEPYLGWVMLGNVKASLHAHHKLRVNPY